jgi:hypothetical protein
MPRVRFTVRRMMVAVAIVAAGLCYARFAIREYSDCQVFFYCNDWSPAQMAAYERSEVIRQKRDKVAALAVPPTLVTLGVAAGAWALGIRRAVPSEPNAQL